MHAETFPPEQALSARAPMFPSPPLLDATAPLAWTHPPTAVQRLLSFFDAGLFRLLGYVALTPLLLRALGELQFGMMATTLALLGMLAWLPRAVQAESSRLVTAAAKVGDAPRVQSLLNATGLLLAAIGIAMAGALVLLRGPLVDALGIEGSAAPLFRTWLLLESVRFGVTVGLGVWPSVVDGFGHDIERASVRGLQAMLEVLFALWVVSRGLGLVGLAALGIVTALATAGLAWWTAGYRQPRPQVRPWNAQPRVMAELLSSSALLGGQQVAFLLAVDTGVLVLAAVQGVQAVVLYAVAAHGIRLLANTGVQLAAGLYPPFASLALHAERIHARWVLRRGTDAALLTCAGLAVFIVPFGAGLLEQWLGLRNVSKPLIALLGLLLLTSAPLAVAALYVARAGRTGRLALVLLAEGTLAIVLGLALVGRQGPVGVATAALVAQSLAAGVLVREACVHLGITPWRFWLGRAWRLAAVLATALVAALLFVAVKRVNTVRDLVIQAGIVVILYAVAGFTVWYLTETRPDQDAD
jgi:O-antigen/teichoic acid export membrane protein